MGDKDRDPLTNTAGQSVDLNFSDDEDEYEDMYEDDKFHELLEEVIKIQADNE